MLVVWSFSGSIDLFSKEIIVRKLNNHKREDFECPCCKTFGVADESLEKLLKAEKLAGFDFKILASYRCASYNKRLKKSVTSSHLVGNAFNIDCSYEDRGCKMFDKRKAFAIVKCCIESGFTRIGFNFHECFIHVDDDLKKRQNVIFDIHNF